MQQQAGRRSGREYAAAARFHQQRRMVGRRIESEHGEFEAVLTLGFAVAAAGIAGRLRENGNNVAFEGNRPRLRQSCDFQGNANGVAAELDDDFSFPLRPRRHQPRAIDNGNCRVNDLVSARPRPVHRLAIDGLGGEQLLGRFRIVECHGRRRNDWRRRERLPGRRNTISHGRQARGMAILEENRREIPAGVSTQFQFTRPMATRSIIP